MSDEAVVVADDEDTDCYFCSAVGRKRQGTYSIQVCSPCHGRALRLLLNPDLARLRQKVRNQRRELRRLNQCLREKTYEYYAKTAAEAMLTAADGLRSAVAALSSGRRAS